MAIPSELVHPSFDSGQGLAILGVGVLVRKRTQEGLASLGGASGGPRAAGLAAWPSEGAVDLGLAVAQASRAVTAPPAEGWLAIGGRAAGWGRRGCWDAWRREARLFLGVPLADGSCWLSLVLSPYSVPARLLRTRPKGALRERFAAMSLYGNWSGRPGVPVTPRYTAVAVGRSRAPSEGHPTPKVGHSSA